MKGTIRVPLRDLGSRSVGYNYRGSFKGSIGFRASGALGSSQPEILSVLSMKTSKWDLMLWDSAVWFLVGKRVPLRVPLKGPQGFYKGSIRGLRVSIVPD